MTVVGGNSQRMRSASNDVANMKKKYDESVQEINRLITVELANYWDNERYTELSNTFKNRCHGDLVELGQTIAAFSKGLTEAADYLDRISR